MNWSIGIDGKLYLTALLQNPNSHFPVPHAVCLDDRIEEIVRKVLMESKTDQDSVAADG